MSSSLSFTPTTWVALTKSINNLPYFRIHTTISFPLELGSKDRLVISEFSFNLRAHLFNTHLSKSPMGFILETTLRIQRKLQDCSSHCFAGRPWTLKGSKICHPKICLFVIKIILSWLLKKENNRHRRSSGNQVEVTLLYWTVTFMRETSIRKCISLSVSRRGRWPNF